MAKNSVIPVVSDVPEYIKTFTGNMLHYQAANKSIDDYAKMADQGRSDFCVVLTMSLCALELK